MLRNIIPPDARKKAHVNIMALHKNRDKNRDKNRKLACCRDLPMQNWDDLHSQHTYIISIDLESGYNNKNPVDHKNENEIYFHSV